MDVRPGWHVRSLRMPVAEAEAIAEGARRLRISQQELIRQCCRKVLGEAGIYAPEPAAAAAGVEEDPFE
jgi:hypothetical protein